MRKRQFTIHSKLPSLNDYILACRQSPYIGAAMKKRIDAQIVSDIMAAGIKTVDNPCIIFLTFYEPDKRRDVDNVESAKKYVLDALVESGVLRGDSPRYVVGVPSVVVHSRQLSWVEVKIIEDADREKLNSRLIEGMNKIVEG
jgi:Holliday junction resolvase RusA-like endonuclease